MSQLKDKNEVYEKYELDPKQEYKSFGNFEVLKLNDLLIKSSELPGITSPSLPSTAIQGLNQVVGDLNGLNTRIEQNEENINLLAQDIDGNTAQININANQITSLVSDVNGNTSLIQQNADAIELRVTTEDFNSQIALTEGKIALKVGDSDSVKAQVVVDAVNGGSVNIDGQRINITGNATFNSLQSQADSTDSDLTNLQNALGDLAYEDLVGKAKLDSTIIDGGYIKTTLLDVDDIFAQNITATGTITGGTFKGGEYYTTKNNDGNTTNGETIKLQYGKINFLYDGDSSAYIKLDESLGSYLRILKDTTSLVDRVRIGIDGYARMDIISSGSDYIDLISVDYIDFNQADIRDVDDLYCDKLRTSRIYTNYMQVSGDNFQFNSCPLAIPNGGGDADDSMPSSDVVAGQMYLKHNSGYVASLWIYDGEDWGYINLNY